MAPVLHQQPTPSPIFPEDSCETLLSRLDDLLEQYLQLLDQYQATRQELSASFSKGFLALAQANYNSSPGRRYGQDYYDERAQAVRRVTIGTADTGARFSIVQPVEGDSTAGNSLGSPKEPLLGCGSESSKDSTDGAPPASGNALLAAGETATDGSAVEGQTITSRSRERDPIHWFGILVPPALRASQACFVDSLEGPIPRLATLQKELRTVEADIGRIRKRIRKS